MDRMGIVGKQKCSSDRPDGGRLEMPYASSIQVNIGAGHLPLAEDNKISYIKIPLDTL